ncbi:MAG: hypothetical protein HZC48_06480 [Nitrospirae bacterium]|nr:hypothetical protein [Nitrospirota bacterium]
MQENNVLTVSVFSPYWGIFRMIFVFFFLYVIGIVFYSWDGFRYYGLFSDFLAGISLVLILWSILTAILAIFIYLSFKGIEWCSLKMGWKIRIENVMMFIGILFILGFPWNSRLLIFKYILLSEQMQPVVIAGIPILSMLFAIIFRNRAISYINIMQERITPLVWLFGAFAVFSVALVSYKIVAYQVWEKKNNATLSEINQSSSDKKTHLI